MVLLGILIVIASRAIAVYTSLSFIKDFPLKFKHALNWGGLKGSLSIALALSLPTDFDGREDILVLTLSAVLFSLIVQGLTIKPLIKMVGIIQKMKVLKITKRSLRAYIVTKRLFTIGKICNANRSLPVRS